ncbi:hypothetical protein [Actinoplanes sp. TFC3]|uniref:hypothetical protein n=1 Tax=Actinoplanes sp. TFC3 TaxID=1710355 RepID=UPI00128FE7B5|nr:hypothetical protein [Actinoplanes sp. TFC3]
MLPRLWDGHRLLQFSRLLQFLTGLALIALAFAVPALGGTPEVPGPPYVVTVVDAPAAAPAGPAAQILVPDAGVVEQVGCDELPAGAAPASGLTISADAALPGSAYQESHSGRAPPA